MLVFAWFLLAPVLPAAEEASTSLFNGRDLDGWTVYTPGADPAVAGNLFTVTDGAIHAYPGAMDGSKQPMGYIITTAEHANYRLSLEYKWGGKKFAPRADPEIS